MIRIKHTTNPFDASSYKVIEIDKKQITVEEAKKLIDIGFESPVFSVKDRILMDTSILNDGDEVIVVEYVVGPGLIPFIMKAIVTLYYVAMAVMIIYSIVMYFRMSKKNTGTSGSGIDDGSPAYSWDGIRTTSDVGIPIAVVYGEHRVGGNVINAFINSDGDKNYLNMLIALCEGEIESISSIYINDQPSANFDGAVFYSRLGTNTDTMIPHFEDLNDNYTVGKSLPALNDNYVYTTISDAVEAFEVQLSFPQGIFQQNESNGNVEAWDVGIKIEYKEHSAGSYTAFVDTTVSAKQRTELKRFFRKEGLTAGQYDIKVTRTTAEADFYHTGEVSLAYIVEVRTDDLAYPNTAKLGMRALATNQISGSTPNVVSLVRGTKVELPKIMQGATEIDWEDYYWDADEEEYRLFADDSSCTWDGTTWVTRWTANPVWCIRDLLTNSRYGLGEHISTAQVDKDSLLAISRYCDEAVIDGLGGYEKRMRLDVVLDSSNRAIDTLMQLMTAFRGIIFYSGTGFKMDIDRPSNPVQLFGNGNIIGGSFQESFKAMKDVPNVLEVQYLDKDEDYKQQVLSVIDDEAISAGQPIRKESIRLYVTRRTQALRDARYMLLNKKYCTRSIVFKASVDAIACQPGDVISVSHDVPQWGFSGRIGTGSTTTSIVLDRTITLESGKTYQIMVRFADDTIETKTINTDPGDVSTVTVSSAFTNAPGAYDVFSVGEVGSVKKDFRIVQMKRTSDLEVEISAVEYNALVYDTESIVLPTYNSSALSLAVPSVTNLKLTERLVRLGDGTIENCIDVWWRRPDANSVYVLYKKAKVYISDDGGDSWELLGETEGETFPIIGGLIDGTEYTVKVVSIATDGREGSFTSSPSDEITLIGKSAPPSDITTFLVNQSRDRLVFTWSAVTDTDLFGYEIRTGDSWESGYVIATQLKSTRYTEYNFKDGSAQKYFIKAVDTSGNYSTTEKEATITVDNIPFTNIIEAYQEQTGWSGTKTDLTKVGDSLEVSTGKLSGTYVTAVKDVGYVANFKVGVNSVVVDATASDQEWDDNLTEEFDDSETKRFSGDEVVGAVGVEIRTSEDNSTWSDYRQWQAGDYLCRYFQLRITLTRETTATVLQMSELNFYADLPDVDENIDGTISTAGSGVDITFTKEFHEDPAVNVTILTGTGVYHKVASLDTTGCNIKLYNISGTAVTGSVRAHIHGV